MKTAFKYVFAAAFMVLLPFVLPSTAWAKDHYYNAKINVVAVGDGTVSVSKTTEAGSETSISDQQKDSTGITHWNPDENRTFNFYLFATPKEGAAFVGWYTDQECTSLHSGQAQACPYSMTVAADMSDEKTLYAKFVKHVHSFNYVDDGSTITKSCVADGCPGGVGGTATLTIASSPTYTASPIAATTSKTGDVVIDGLSYATAAGSALGGAPTDVGDYKVTMSVDNGAKTLTKAFSIVQATIDSVTFNPASQNYDGSAKSTAMTVKAGALTLGAGDYDITAGTLSGVVGSPAEDVTTTVTVKGKGNFTGEKSASWSIVAPSGSFAADAASGGVGCTASGTSVELTDSLALNPTYDSEKKTWKAAMTIAMPTPDTKESEWNASNGSAKYVKDDTTFVTVGDVSCAVAQSGSIPGVSFANAEGSYVSAIDFWNAKTTTKFTYLSSVTYTLEFSVADVEAAKAAGKIEKSITVWSIIWSGDKNQGHDTGLKATTYTLTIPIDDKLILQDTEGRQIYPPHQHNWAYAVSADGKTLVATCQAQGCPQESLSFGFTGETAKTYDGTALAAQLTDSTEFVKHTGATIGSITYDDAADQPVSAGEHTAKVVITVGGGSYVISQTMTINPAAFDLSLNISSVNYDGAAKTVVATAKFGQKTLAEGTDYDISGDNRTQTGSPASNCTYTVIATGKGNFANCEKSASWTIVAPSGSFAADAASGTGCTASGTSVELTDSLALNPTYDSEKGTWKASMTIAMPAPDTKDSDWNASNGSAKYVKDSTTFVSVGGVSCAVAQSGSIPGLSFANAPGSYASSKNIVGSATTTTFTYLSSLTYTLEFSVADIEAAKAAGKIEKSITVWSIIWSGDKNQGHDTGLKATTYTLTIPIDDKLILQDTEGRQIYPPHQHSWVVESADDAQVTVACSAQGCPQGGALTLALAAESRDYDGAAFAATLTGADDFRTHVGATVGAITYWAKGAQLQSAPKYTGDYEARVAATVLDTPYTLVVPFAIRKPAGGYTSGYELGHGTETNKWVRYDTYAEAIAAATDGDTVYRRESGNIDSTEYDFTSDKNITCDLCGCTLKQTKENKDSAIVNKGTGTVRLVNVTVQQPKGSDWLSSAHPMSIQGQNNGGRIILGSGVRFNNIASSDGNYMTVTVKGIVVAIEDGVYLANFKAGENGSLEISGGKFWSQFSSVESYLKADGRHLVRTDGTETASDADDKSRTLKYVVLAHDHKPTYVAEGGVITVTCTEANNDVCEFGSGTLTLTAKNRSKNGKPYELASIVYEGNFPEEAKVGTDAIVYFSGDTQLGSAPSEPGKYVAKVTVGGATAAVEFEIYKLGLVVIISSVL